MALSVGRSLIPAPGMADDCYDWLRPHDPVDRIGHSILVYRIDPPASAGERQKALGPEAEARKP